MVDNSKNIINEINFTKRCILIAVISKDKNLILINSFNTIPIVKLYTADSSYENFIYSKIKGAFCIMMSREKDIKERKYFLRIYSLKNYSLLFNMEIKKEHMQYITQYKEDFYFMELRSSFLGFKFLSNNSARIFFLLLTEDPKEEVIKQNEGAQNINPKNISKTLNKVNDNIKTKLKNIFKNQIINSTSKAPYANYKRNTAPIFNLSVINNQKLECLDTSILPEMEILLNNLEIDDQNSNCYLFTEKKLNLQKCKEIVNSFQIKSNENKYHRRTELNIPITIIDKDCQTIGNVDLYTEIMTQNMINNIQTQKALDTLQKEYKKKHRLSAAIINQPQRKTKSALNKINTLRNPYLSSISNRISLHYNSTVRQNRSSNYMKICGASASSEKVESKSVDKENSGKFADDKRQINSLVKTNVFKEMDDEDDDNLKKGENVIEERNEDEEKDFNQKIKDIKSVKSNNRRMIPEKKEYVSLNNFLMSKK